MAMKTVNFIFFLFFILLVSCVTVKNAAIKNSSGYKILNKPLYDQNGERNTKYDETYCNDQKAWSFFEIDGIKYVSRVYYINNKNYVVSINGYYHIITIDQILPENIVSLKTQEMLDSAGFTSYEEYIQHYENIRRLVVDEKEREKENRRLLAEEKKRKEEENIRLLVEEKQRKEEEKNKTEEEKKKLGGGYQNTKWGMTIQEVKNILGSNNALRFDGEGNSDDGDRVLQYISKASRDFKIMLFFYNNKLYYVEYHPFIDSSDRNTANMLLNELKRKYGNGRSFVTRLGLNLPPGYDVTEWNDGETIIRFQIGWFEDRQGRINSYDYTNAIYYSIAIQKEKDNAKAQKEADQKRKTNDSLRNNL